MQDFQKKSARAGPGWKILSGLGRARASPRAGPGLTGPGPKLCQNQSYYNAVVGNLNHNHNQNQSFNNDFNQKNYHRGHQYQEGYQNPAYNGSMQQGSQRKHHWSNHGQQQHHHHHHH